MLDIKYIVHNASRFSASAQQRNVRNFVPELVSLYEKSLVIQQELEKLQQERAHVAKEISQKTDDERAGFVARGKELKQQISERSTELKNLQNDIQSLALQVPNTHHPSAPLGKEEKDNLVIKTHGTARQFSFAPKNHIDLCTELDIVNFTNATKVSGPKFYYLKNEAVLLELALIRFGIDILREHGFAIFQTPDIARTSIVESIGFNPRGKESNIYNIENEGASLIGTAEITLGGYYANSIIPLELLPIKMAGLSHCFRRESGAAGQYSKGLYRVHQFTKLEMFVFCYPDESEKMHDELVSIEENLYQKLEIPYRIVDTCTGDLGAPAYRKFDIEAWMPGRGENGEYGEVTSASNCTDYQSRRLGIRIQHEDASRNKQRIFPHTLNGTAFAIPRTLVAMVENFQNEDGSIRIPDALVPYCGFSSLEKKRT